MGNDIKVFLVKIRFLLNKKMEELIGVYLINFMLNKVGMIWKGRKRIRLYMIVNGWYMYGRNVGKLRLGCWVVMIRVYVEKVLRIYKRLGLWVSFFWLRVVKM